MRLLIVYNGAFEKSRQDDLDLLSEVAVEDEAMAVFEAARDLGMQSSLLSASSVTGIFERILSYKPDVIFNLCEGFLGDARHEMHVASLWELLQIPYTGNAPLTLGLAQDKVISKRLFESKKIRTPAYQVYQRIPESTMLNYPLIAKPSREDASLGIGANAVLHSMEDLKREVGRIIEKYRQPVLVEEYIHGREFNISLMGDKPKVLAVSEIDFSGLSEDEDWVTSYEAKWMPDHPLYRKTPVRVPASVPTELKSRLDDVAVQVYKLLRGRDYARVDTRVDSQGRIYVLELNPNPDISPDAGFTKAVRASGMTYREFVAEIIQYALDRKTI